MSVSNNITNKDILQSTKKNITNGIKESLPTTNSIKFLDIEYGVSYPKAYYGVIYHMLSIIVEIQNANNLNANMLYFAQYDKVNIPNNDIINYDYSYIQLFRGTSNIKSGSSMTNNTYIFATDLITLDILSCLQNMNKNKMTIKFSTIVATPVIQLLEILTYIYENVTIEKHDMWLNDSFIVICENLISDRYNKIKNKLPLLSEKNRQKKIISLFSDFKVNTILQNKINKIVNLIGSTVVNLWTTIINNINKSPKDRSKKIWQNYDNLFIKNK